MPKSPYFPKLVKSPWTWNNVRQDTPFAEIQKPMFFCPFKFGAWTDWRSELRSFETLIQLLGVYLIRIIRSYYDHAMQWKPANPLRHPGPPTTPSRPVSSPCDGRCNACAAAFADPPQRSHGQCGISGCPWLGIPQNGWFILRQTLKNLFKWMAWGYPHLRKRSYCHATILYNTITFHINTTTIWSSLVFLRSTLGSVQNVFVVQDQCVQFSVCKARSNAAQGFKLTKIQLAEKAEH